MSYCLRDTLFVTENVGFEGRREPLYIEIELLVADPALVRPSNHLRDVVLFYFLHDSPHKVCAHHADLVDCLGGEPSLHQRPHRGEEPWGIDHDALT